MYIYTLKLINFRNYIKKEFNFKNQKIMICGRNGTGKTSLLEAICLLCFGRSFQAKKDTNLINLNNSELFLSGEFCTKDDSNLDISISISAKKNIKINNKSIERLSHLIGKVNTILFSERDIDIIERSPKRRRRFIDIIFSQIDNDYLNFLIKYQKILEQRNFYLKTRNQDKDLLESLNRNLVECGTEIVYLRLKYLKEFIIFLNNIIAQYNISCLKDMNIKYSNNITNNQNEEGMELEKQSIKDLFYKKLISSYKKEQDFKFTFIGPHRDDIIFLKDEKNRFLEYSSAGERRLLAIMLKITESKFLFENKKDLPIILLDDILLELDKENSGLIMDYINLSENQFFIATTDENEYNKIDKIELIQL